MGGCAARADPPIARRGWNRLNGARSRACRPGWGGGGGTGWTQREGHASQDQQASMDVGLARDPVMLDCRELQPRAWGPAGTWARRCLLRSNTTLTSPTGGGSSGLGTQAETGAVQDDPGELTVKFGACKLRDASVAAVAGAVAVGRGRGVPSLLDSITYSTGRGYKTVPVWLRAAAWARERSRDEKEKIKNQKGPTTKL